MTLVVGLVEQHHTVTVGVNVILTTRIDVIVLYRSYTYSQDSLFGINESNRWRIALHRTPYQTVLAALKEAWPCENYDAEKHGYNLIHELQDF